MKKAIILGMIILIVLVIGLSVEKTIERTDGRNMWDSYTCMHTDNIEDTVTYAAPFKVYKLFGMRLFRTYLKEGNGCSYWD